MDHRIYVIIMQLLKHTDKNKFEQYWKMFNLNCSQIGLDGFDKKVFKVFPFDCHDNQNLFLTTLKEDYPRIIPVKSGDNLPKGLGDAF